MGYPVSNQPVPEWAKAYPLMRHAAAFDDFGKVICWRIISAATQLTPQELIRTPLHTELTLEQKKLSIREIWPHAVMVRKLARGWTPEHADELRLPEIDGGEKRKGSSGHKRRDSEPMKHYLYFSKKQNAEEAGEQLRRRGFSVEVRKGASEEDWLAMAIKTPPETGEQMDVLRDEIEALAVQFGGEYDGWEAAIDSLGSDGNGKVN